MLHVARADDPTGLLELAPHRGERVVIEGKLGTQDFGGDFRGQIIRCWAESACRDHEMIFGEETAKRCRKDGAIVADALDANNVEAERGQLLSEPLRVGVCDLPLEELGADRQEGNGHERNQ